MRFWFSLLLLLTVSACATKLEDRLDLATAQFENINGWQVDDMRSAFIAFKLSCESIMTLGDDSIMGQGILASPARMWKPACNQALTTLEPSVDESREFFEQYFSPYEASNRGKREGLFTGYFVPELRGSLKRHDAYQVPVYGVPSDLVAGTSYFTREEIDRGAMGKSAPILVWVDDAVDLFFTQIQGSGNVTLDDGETLLIGYAAQNGQSYVAIGKTLIEREELQKENVSMDSIKAWLRSHPDQAEELMHENPSYVFFKPVNVIKGGQGVELTPMRSIAIDKRFIPYGMPVFIQSTLPARETSEPSNFTQLMIAQDTGGAIKGPVRADVFFGFGERAANVAGYMKQPGNAVLLLPQELAAKFK